MATARMIPEPCRVLEAFQATAKEMHFVLEAPKQEPFRPEPGQFVMVSLPGIGEAPISIAAIPGELTPEGTFELLIRKAGRLTNLVTRLKEGDVLYVRGPYGRRVGWEAFRGSNIALIAGGLGLAPLRPFVRRALMRRQDFRRIDIAVGARSPEELLFRDDIASWSARHDDVHVGVTVDAASNGWGGRIGVITTLFDDIVGRLLKSGLVVESPGQATSAGRPRNTIAFNNRAGAVLAVDLSGTTCHGMLADLSGATFTLGVHVRF